MNIGQVEWHSALIGKRSKTNKQKIELNGLNSMITLPKKLKVNTSGRAPLMVFI